MKGFIEMTVSMSPESGETDFTGFRRDRTPRGTYIYIRQLARDCGLPFTETAYHGRSQEEIRRHHRSGLARIDLAASQGGTALIPGRARVPRPAHRANLARTR
jgi:hypothetical protein